MEYTGQSERDMWGPIKKLIYKSNKHVIGIPGRGGVLRR